MKSSYQLSTYLLGSTERHSDNRFTRLKGFDRVHTGLSPRSDKPLRGVKGRCIGYAKSRNFKISCWRDGGF